MKITTNHARYWLSKNAPAFIKGSAAPVSIHTLIPQGDPVELDRAKRCAGNTLAILAGYRRRTGSCRAILTQMAEYPGTVIDPKRRAGYCAKWLRKLNTPRP